MRLILDTPIWVWSLLEPGRLRPSHRAALEDPGAELWLSPVSVWEILALIDAGRISVDGEPDGWVADALRAVPMREAPLTNEVAARSHSLKLAGVDPAGRLVAATAQVYDLTLVTQDRRMAASKEVSVLAAS